MKFNYCRTYTSREMELKAKYNRSEVENVSHSDPILISMCSIHQDVTIYDD